MQITKVIRIKAKKGCWLNITQTTSQLDKNSIMKTTEFLIEQKEL